MEYRMYEALLVGGVVLWLAAVGIYARSGLASVYHPATYYLFFHGFIFVFRPIVAHITGFDSIYKFYEFTPSMYVKQMVLIGANLGFAAFMVAVMKTGREPLVLKPTRWRQPDTQRGNQLALLLTVLLLAPLGIASQISGLANRTNNNDMVLDAATGHFINTTGNGYFSNAAAVLGALVVLLAWQFRFRLVALLPFAAYVGVRAAAGGARWTFLLTSVSMGLFFLYDRKLKWPSPRVIALGLAALALFVVVGEQRDIFIAYLNGEPPREDLFKDRFLEGMDFGNLEYYEFLVSIIPDRTHTWGYFLDNLQVFTEPVPRILWPGKPIGPPIQLWQIFDYGNPIGMTNSLPGEGWSQLGLIGVAFWCGLWGATMGWLYNLFARSRQTGYQVALYLLLLPITVQFFRDGLLISALRFSMFYLVAVGLWKAIGSMIQRSTAPAVVPRTVVPASAGSPE
jgi:hypothetical protein